MGPHVDEHSKRSRGNLSVNSQLLPLSIDIEKVVFHSYIFFLLNLSYEQQVYQPQTEAISPIPDDLKNDSNMRDSTMIRNAITKIESEIELTMKRLDRARANQVI